MLWLGGWMPAAEVGGVVLAEGLDLGEFGEGVEFPVEAAQAAGGYQHATADRDAAIARALSDLATAQKPAVVLNLADQP